MTVLDAVRKIVATHRVSEQHLEVAIRLLVDGCNPEEVVRAIEGIEECTIRTDYAEADLVFLEMRQKNTKKIIVGVEEVVLMEPTQLEGDDIIAPEEEVTLNEAVQSTKSEFVSNMELGLHHRDAGCP